MPSSATYKNISNLPRRILASYQWYRFTSTINQETLRLHDELLNWSLQMAINSRTNESEALYLASRDPIVTQGARLVKEVKAEFTDCCKHWKDLRILVHLPPFQLSPGGFSLYNNLIMALKFIGLNSRALEWQEDIETVLKEFNPTFLLTSDSEEYLACINWTELSRYRKHHKLKLGLTAAPEEFGNTPLNPRLKWAQQNKVDFYYSFHSDESLRMRSLYKPFFDLGYRIISIQFGANPLLFYPVPSIERDLNYVFLASSNVQKRARYFQYLTPIFQSTPGFINGPGWPQKRHCAGNRQEILMPIRFSNDRYLYARAKVGINLHIQDSIEWPSELNERTYMLAACGTPQLVDSPLLLPINFSNECFFVGRNPKEYNELFHYINDDPLEAERRALQAQQEVFLRHTCFHRARDLALAFKEMI
jgi:hypothetical protein